MQFEVVFTGLITMATDPGDVVVDVTAVEGALDAHLDGVMDELLHLNATDPGIGLTSSTGTVEISVLVETQNLDEAMATGGGLIRTAVHAAGGHTPGWTISWVAARTTDTSQLVPA